MEWWLLCYRHQTFASFGASVRNFGVLQMAAFMKLWYGVESLLLVGGELCRNRL